MGSHSNHEKFNQHQKQKVSLNQQVKEKALANMEMPPKNIIRKTMLNMDTNELMYNDVKNASQRIHYVRKKIQPKLPKNKEEGIADLERLQNNPRFKTNKEEIFIHPFIALNIVIITCLTNLQRLCGHVDYILADGTFSYAPKHWKQLYTIHGYVYGHYIPLVYSFLPDKSQNTYEALWRLLCAMCANLGLELNPPVIMLDYEIGAHNAFRAIFGGQAAIGGCRFHLGQSWWRFIQGN